MRNTRSTSEDTKTKLRLAAFTGNDDKDLAIIKYIEENQGCSQESVVKAFEKGKYGIQMSRMTVIGHIKKLEGESKPIRREEGQRNGQRDKLFVDEVNPLVSVPDQIRQFESVFLKLFNLTIRRFRRNIDRSRKTYGDLVEHSVPIGSCILLYSDFVHLQTLQSLFGGWSQKLQDDDVVRLHGIIQKQLDGIHLKMNEELQKLPRPHIINLERMLADDMDLPDKRRLKSTYQFLTEKHDIDIKLVEPVIDALWHFNLEHLVRLSPELKERIRDFQDWQNVNVPSYFEYYRKQSDIQDIESLSKERLLELYNKNRKRSVEIYREMETIAANLFLLKNMIKDEESSSDLT